MQTKEIKIRFYRAISRFPMTIISVEYSKLINKIHLGGVSFLGLSTSNNKNATFFMMNIKVI